MKGTFFPSLLLGLVAGLTVPCAHSADPPETPAPPRYRLEVGQQLVYEGSSQFKYERGSHKTTDKTTLWVTRQNPDESWHIVAHGENSFIQVYGEGDGVLGPGDKHQSFDAFDLHPDGRIANPPQGYRQKALSAAFIPLPADLASAQHGWQQEKDDGDKSLYQLAPRSDATTNQWVFARTDKNIFDDIYLSTSKATIHFDAGRGLVTNISSEYTQGYGFNGKGTGITTLKSVTKRDAEWIAQLNREANLLLQAKAAVRDALKAVKQGDDREETVTAAELKLRDGRDKVKLPMVTAHFDDQLEQLKSSARHIAEDRKREEDVLNKAAADWHTTDIDGNKHALANYRGKVVVLDFWYRGCGWCIKAMPQIKEVTDHYKDRPVAVLGMNTDREEKDARFVVDKLKLNYTTLKAEGLPEKYGVQGFPTLILIDQTGIVRGRHVGYSATLREELIKEIDGLLANAE